MSEPKLCPFCGSKDVGGAGGQVHCYSCPAIIEVQNTNTNYAVELWNRRADSAELTAARDEAERLRGRIAQLESAVPWTIYGDNLTATVLRKQAEAVEAEAKRLKNDNAEHWLDRNVVVKHLESYAQRLRTKADKLELGGGNDPT